VSVAVARAGTRVRAVRRSWWRSATGDPAWARPGLLALLGATALLYLWGLGASGWANSYYSAAVQAGATSWKAFLFGASDAGGSITVDKTPASLWVMGLSARVFGVNAWSILVPQALAGVGAVGVLAITVKRWFGAAAGLLAGAVMATTPVAVLMFRFNNPDALLVLLLVLGAYATTRAIEDGRTVGLVLAGVAVGFGFLTKELQAFVVVPVFAGAYLVAGPPRLARRIGQLVAMGAATLVAAGWWVAIVVLVPASARPYIGGSQDNTFWNVLFGYNGLGRLTGEEAGSVGGGGGQAGRWGATGLLRMFNDSFGAQASWLIPAALLVLGVGLVVTLRRPRTDRARAALLLWGGWLVLTGLVFSLSRGIIHEYYTVALAPAIGALVGIGGVAAWQHRDRAGARVLLGAGVALSAVWSCVLLGRTPDWFPWLRVVVLVGGLATMLVLAAWPRLTARTSAVVGAAAVAVVLAGPLASGIATAAVPHTGSIPLAGPTGGRGGGPGGFGGPGGTGGPGAAIGAAPGGFGAAPGGIGAGAFGAGAFGGGGAGGLLQGSTPSARLTARLGADAAAYDWVAAVVGANQAAGYQLATGAPVMPIGGFNGSDPSPTLAQFRRYVAEGRIHYFLASGAGGGFGGMGGSGTGGAIARWVEQHFRSTTVGGVTLYDLTTRATA
jgi:4-amino-4-deoxy-L-arabinose transferase-like glycosyltransferase